MRKLVTSAWFVRAVTAISFGVFVAGVVVWVSTRPDPSPATNTVPYDPDYELPDTTPKWTAEDVPLEARRVAGDFILAAAGREDLEKAWAITHPILRQGLTKQEWLTGNIPVTFYPAGSIDTASYSVDALTSSRVSLKVLLLPKKGSDVKPQVFAISLKASGNGTGKAWLVDYWGPVVSIPVPATP